MLVDLCRGFVWLLIAGALGLFLAGWLKQAFLALLCRFLGPAVALGVYAMLTLPGFFLHEGAHILVALALGVPVRGFTLIPRPDPEGLSAAVEVSPRGPIRMAAVALAPLLAGMAALALLTTIFPYDPGSSYPWMRLAAWPTSWRGSRAEFWFHLYLIWAISSHMAPSRGDMVYVLRGAIALPFLVLVGWGLARLFPNFLDPWNAICTRLGDGFALAAAGNAVCLLPVGLLLWATRGR
ncbi:MAG: hypothetical protein ACP5SI_11090 [Chloroflexia bacterium]